MNTTKSFFYIFLFVFLLVFSNCKKEKEQENPSPSDTPITIISPNDNAMVYDSILIEFSIAPGLNIIRTECYVEFELVESFDNVPTELYFYSNNYNPGDTIQYFLKIYAKDGQEYNSNIVVLVISQLSQPTLTINILSNEEVELTWSDGSNSEDGFMVYRSTNNLSFDILAELEPNTISFIDNAIDTLNTYKYKVDVHSEYESRTSNLLELSFIQKFRQFQEFVVPESPSSNIALSEDLSKLVVTNYHEDHFTLLDIKTGTITSLFHPDGTKGLAMSKTEGFFATAGSHNSLIKIWGLETGELIKEFPAQSRSYELCLNNTSEHLVAAGSPTLIYGVSDASLIIELQSESTVRALHYAHKESLLITAGNDDLIKIWDVNSGELIRTLVGHTGHIGSIALSLDESQIISGSYEDNTIRVWDFNSGALLNTYERGSGIASLAVDNENRIIAATYDGSISVMTIDEEIIQAFEGHEYLMAMDYNNSHNVIATFGHDSAYSAILYKIIGQWETIEP